MADGLIYCKQCKEATEQTHIHGRTVVCSVCGETNLASQVKKLKASIAERKAASLASVARAGGIIAEPEEKVTPVRLSDKGDVVMAYKRLTVEQKADVKRRKEAGEKPEDLAAEYGVNRCTIFAAARGGWTRKPKGKKPAKPAAPAHQEAQPAHSVEAGGAFKSPLARFIHDEVERQVAVMHKELTAALNDMDLDTKVEAAMARMLK